MGERLGRGFVGRKRWRQEPRYNSSYSDGVDPISRLKGTNDPSQANLLL